MCSKAINSKRLVAFFLSKPERRIREKFREIRKTEKAERAGRVCREAAEKGKTEIKDFTESAKRSGAEGKDTSSLSAWCPFREVFSTG